MPQVLVTWLSDFRYEGLYLLPLMAFAGMCAILLTVSWNHLGMLERLLLGALLFIEPLALNHTGQLLNPPFGVLFALLGVLCLTRREPLDNMALALAALMFFCAYGAHVTYLAFAGGAFAWLWSAKYWSKAWLLAALIGALMALETVFFNYLSGWTLELGRLQALAGTPHVEKVSSWPLYRPGQHQPVVSMVTFACFQSCAGRRVYRPGLTAWLANPANTPQPHGR